MKVKFYNLNNNDVEHDIIFLNMTFYSSGKRDITVLFDGVRYKYPVYFNGDGSMYFRNCGKNYDFEIVE